MSDKPNPVSEVSKRAQELQDALLDSTDGPGSACELAIIEKHILASNAEAISEANVLKEENAKLREALRECSKLCPELRHHGGIGDEYEQSNEHRSLIGRVGNIVRAALLKEGK